MGRRVTPYLIGAYAAAVTVMGFSWLTAAARAGAGPRMLAHLTAFALGGFGSAILIDLWDGRR